MRTLKFTALLLVCSLFVFTSCNNNSRPNTTATEIAKSTSTPREAADLRMKINQVVSNNVVMENDRLKLDISRKEFTDMGIPGKYYRTLNQDLRIISRDANKTSRDLEEVWKDFNRMAEY